WPLRAQRRRRVCFFFSSRRRHTIFSRDWSSGVCSSDLAAREPEPEAFADEEPSGGSGAAFDLAAIAGALEEHSGRLTVSVGDAEIGRASCRERLGDRAGAAAMRKQKEGELQAGHYQRRR